MSTSAMTDEQLYEAQDAAVRLRSREGGRRKNPEAAHVRAWCKRRIRDLRAELRRRGLPIRREEVAA